ncbi:hypothetical protein C1H46_016034 [Malus baccata]|uniref:Uncharacterized protein n=1 Tax=Malus baccata TaxID=106549 RepID=A0A540MI69_MALBA|nr:hypothetical protein C1H46_016034 [Malus baccata]
MSKQIHEIKGFLLTARRKDACNVKIKRTKDAVKFKSAAKDVELRGREALREKNEREPERSRESDLGSDAELHRDPNSWTRLPISSHP